MLLLNDLAAWSLPLEDPVLKFLVILLIILLSPLLLDRLRVPQLLGLIVAGAIVGPYGFGVMERDEGIILSGTAGLLYIMFLAGLEIDLGDFKKNSRKSVVFGLITFTIPMVLGTIASVYYLGFTWMTGVLLASMFASHTLIVYPMISRMGLAKNQAVNITVGGTVITDTLALLVLAVVIGMTTGEVNAAFWLRLGVSLVVFALLVLLVFPLVGRWFFKRVEDNVSQFVFVIAMVFLGAVLAELAGVEAIIGAFLAGLALNRLIPATSPLMNRIEFVGNAIFIPFFLIGVGMLIDYTAFLDGPRTLQVAGVMIVVATAAKFVAAWVTQRVYGFTADERRLIFGLSNAQAAATLAAVLVGYNTIVGTTDAGEAIRLLDQSVLNGTILMILFTCTVASFAAQRGAQRMAELEAVAAPLDERETAERILLPLSDPSTAEELLRLALAVKGKKNVEGLHALYVVDNRSPDGLDEKQGKKVIAKAAETAAAADHHLQELIRYDLNVVNGIYSVVKERNISDIILGIQDRDVASGAALGTLTQGILAKCPVTTLVYKASQPLSTIKRHLVVVPPNAERELGFPFWLVKVWNLARNTGATVEFFGNATTLGFLRDLHEQHPIECSFEEFGDWQDFLILGRTLRANDNLVVVMSRRGKVSYNSTMERILSALNKYFKDNSFLLIYPQQELGAGASIIDYRNPTLLEPIEKLDEIGRAIGGIFRRRGGVPLPG